MQDPIITKKRKMKLWNGFQDIDSLCFDTIWLLTDKWKLRTIGSCCGDEDNPYIAFKIYNEETLFPFLAFLKKHFKFKKNLEIKPIKIEKGKALSVYLKPENFHKRPIDWSKRKFKEKGLIYFWNYFYEHIKGFNPKFVPEKDVQDIILRCNKCGFVGTINK